MSGSAGCGRLGYDATPGDGDDAGTPDATFDMNDAGDMNVQSDMPLDMIDEPDAADAEMDMAMDMDVDLGPPPVPGIVVDPTTGLTTTEAGGMATFTVVLASEPLADVVIELSSSDTTEGTVAPAMLTFTAINWAAPQTVTLTGVDDDEADGSVMYNIVTAAAMSTDPAYSGLDADDVSVSNTDNDTPGVTVTPTSGLVVAETGSSDTFTVVLNAAPTDDVNIGVSSGDETEATALPALLTFTPMNWNAPQTVTVTGVDDVATDGDQLFTIELDYAMSADLAYNGLDVDDATGTNRDDESPAIVIDPTSGLETSEAGGTATFSIVLQSEPVADVMIPLVSSDTGEGTVEDSVVFTTTNWNVPRAVVVSGVDDELADGNQAFHITVGPATSSDPLYNARTASDVSVTNRDDDTAGFTVTPTSGLVTTEGGSTVTYSVVLNSRPSASVVFTMTSSDTTEAVVTPSTYSFTPSTWNVPRTFTVTGVDDGVADGDQPFNITVHVSISADINYSGLADVFVSGTNVDNETPGITVTPTSGISTTEAGGTATFTVVLNSQPTGSVSLNLSSDTPAEGTVSPSSFTFTAFNWNTPQLATVTGVNDLVADGARMYTIVTSAATSSDGSYSGLNASDVSVTNLDNDTAGIRVIPTSILAPEVGAPGTFTVRLLSQPTATVQVPLHMLDVAQGTLAPAMLTFTTGNWSVAQTVTCTGVADGIPDGTFVNTAFTDAAISTDLTYNGMDADDVTVTHREAGGVTITPTSGLVTTEAGGTASFTIVLTSAPAANVFFAFASSNSAEGNPMIGSGNVTFTPSDWNVPRTITIVGYNDYYADGDKLYTVITGAASSSDSAYSGLNPPDVSVTNTDNDHAGITLTSTGPSTTENGGTVHLAVRCDSAISAQVNIVLTSTDLTEGTVLLGSVGLGAFSTDPAAASPYDLAVVTGVDDFLQDGDVPYSITATVTSADPAYNGIAVTPLALTNVDNENASNVVVSPTAGLTVTDFGATSLFTVVLRAAPASAVTINLASADTGEATVSPASLVFTPANWASPRTVTVTGVSDSVLDGDTPVLITTTVAGGSDPAYLGMDPPDVTVMAIDADSEQCPSVDSQFRLIPSQLNTFGHQQLSADGRFATFTSAYPGLVAGDTNALRDIFQRDRLLHTTTRISLADDESQISSSSGGAMSGDGRYVVFLSNASGTIAGYVGSPSVYDIFVRDTLLNTTTRVSVPISGSTLDAGASSPSMSGDGRFVAFESAATNLVAGDTNGVSDVFVRDRMLNTTVRANLSTGGAQDTGYSHSPSMSANGRYVVFISTGALTSGVANGVGGVYMRDLVTNTTTLVSRGIAGANPNGYALRVRVNADGRYVVYTSSASNLVAGDTNGVEDAFLYDTMLDTTTRVSVSDAESQGNARTEGVDISADGNIVVFTTFASNFFVGDGSSSVDVFVRNIAAGTTHLVTTGWDGSLANGSADRQHLCVSQDGESVLFESWASNLLPERFDPDVYPEVYIFPTH